MGDRKLRRTLIFDTSAVFNFGYRGGAGGEKIIKLLGQEHTLITPEEVRAEVLDDQPLGSKYDDFLAAYFEMRGPVTVPGAAADELRKQSERLDTGEVAVLALGLALNATVVMDEKSARRVAHALKLSLTGTIGLLNEAVERGQIEAEFAHSLVIKIHAAGGRLIRGEMAPTWAEFFCSLTDQQQH